MNYLDTLKKFGDVNGRASVAEYWTFALINIVINFLLGIIKMEMASLVFGLLVFIPGICCGIRRLHDTGKSGWNYLYILIPIIGWILLLIWLIKAGDVGENAYGDNPINPTSNNSNDA